MASTKVQPSLFKEVLPENPENLGWSLGQLYDQKGPLRDVLELPWQHTSQVALSTP